MKISPQKGHVPLRNQSLLWIGLLLPPLGWFVYPLVNYMLVPWACVTGVTLPLHVLTVVVLLVTLSAGGMAWLIWQRVGPQWPDEAGGVIPRSRFLAMLGLLSGGLFFLIVLAQGTPTLMLHPCQL